MKLNDRLDRMLDFMESSFFSVGNEPYELEQREKHENEKEIRVTIKTIVFQMNDNETTVVQK